MCWEQPLAEKNKLLRDYLDDAWAAMLRWEQETIAPNYADGRLILRSRQGVYAAGQSRLLPALHSGHTTPWDAVESSERAMQSGIHSIAMLTVVREEA